VPGMGTPPFVFANRVFGTHGVRCRQRHYLESFSGG
jgi:hypothetical protein